MDKELLSKTAAAMVAKGKGILAADESSGTCEKRFKSVNVECTEENRRAYRDLLFSTPGIEQFLSGVILFDETRARRRRTAPRFPSTSRRRASCPASRSTRARSSCRSHARRERHRGTRQPVQAAWTSTSSWAPLREVARRDHDRQDMPSPACIHANAAGARALRRGLPGGIASCR